jgi:hypothetical protein
MRLHHDDEAAVSAPGSAGQPPFHELFVSRLAEESRAILQDLSDDLRRIALPGLEHVTVRLDADDWKVGGAVTPNKSGGVDLSVSFGLVLAIEEATLEFFSYADAVCPIHILAAAENGAEMPFEVTRYSYDESGRIGALRDYRHLRGTAFGPESVTTGFPTERWRLRQQDLFFTLMLRWAALHEIAHGALAHLDVLGDLFGKKRLSLGIAETDHLTDVTFASLAATGMPRFDVPPDLAVDEGSVRKIFELHADMASLWLSIDLERWSRAGERSLFDRYEKDMRELVEIEAHHFVTLDTDQRLHFTLLAALLTIILFEHGRLARHRGAGLTHPFPEARYIMLLLSGFYGSDLCDAVDGEPKIKLPPGAFNPENESSSWSRFLQDAIARSVEDMEFFAAVLDLEISTLDPTKPKPEIAPEWYVDGYLKPISGYDVENFSPWWRDVYERNAASLRGSSGEKKSVTAHSRGGIELAELEPLGDYLQAASEQAQLNSKGSALTFLLTIRGRWA